MQDVTNSRLVTDNIKLAKKKQQYRICMRKNQTIRIGKPSS